MPRAFILVLDSVGIGGAPTRRATATRVPTVGHIADACWIGAATAPAYAKAPCG